MNRDRDAGCALCNAAPPVTALSSLQWPLLKWNIKCLNRNIKVSIDLLGNEVFLPKVTPEGQSAGGVNQAVSPHKP